MKKVQGRPETTTKALAKWGVAAKLPISSFRSSAQQDAAERVIAGEDVMVVMPTGAGKSLIYQFPAWLERQSLTLVISPLLALMKQHAEMFGATTINKETIERDDVWREVSRGRRFILLVSPEMLAKPEFRRKLVRALRVGKRGLGRFVVDEVHCLSDWGHDFRPHYWWVAHHLRTLEGKCRLAKGLRRVPRLLLTATADRNVTDDIIRHFPEVEDPARRITVSVARPEIVLLSKRVKTPTQRIAALSRFLTRQATRLLPAGVRRRGIIFNLEAVHADDDRTLDRPRLRANEVQRLLRNRGQRHIYTFTSGGMNSVQRAATATAFENAKTRRGQVTSIVATSAFGMGMDYSKVPFVVHMYPRPSLAEYWQQVGRAGRDMDSDCSWAEALTLYSKDDDRYARRFAKAPALDGLLNAYTVPLFGWMYVWHKDAVMALRGPSGTRVSKFGRLVKCLQEIGVISDSAESVRVPKGAMRYRVDIAALKDPKVIQRLEGLRDGQFKKAKKIKKVFRYLLIAARSRQRKYISLDRTDYYHDKAGTVLTRLNRWVDIGLLSLDESPIHPGEIRLKATTGKLRPAAIREIQRDARAWERHKVKMVDSQMDVLKASSPRKRAELVLRHFGEHQRVVLPANCLLPAWLKKTF